MIITILIGNSITENDNMINWIVNLQMIGTKKIVMQLVAYMRAMATCMWYICHDILLIANGKWCVLAYTFVSYVINLNITVGNDLHLYCCAIAGNSKYDKWQMINRYTIIVAMEMCWEKVWDNIVTLCYYI